MEDKEFETRASIEDNMWWFRASHAIQLWSVDRFVPKNTGWILEAGCGTGGILGKLQDRFEKWSILGVDSSDVALALAACKTSLPLVRGSVNQLPFGDNLFCAMVSSDVLYHGMVNPNLALSEARRCLVPGGILEVTVPAYEWLSSDHDVRNHGVRRYTKTDLVKDFQLAGLEVVYSTYWNTLLFPFMVLRRKVFRSAGGCSDVMHFPPILNMLLSGVMAFERLLLYVGLRFPFGGSVLVVGRKPLISAGGEQFIERPQF